MYTGPRDEEPGGPEAELARYEREREQRKSRRDQVSWKIIGWVMAGALALLSYDSAGAAADARHRGRPWLYPAGISLTCAIALVVLVVLVLRRRRAQGRDRRGG